MSNNGLLRNPRVAGKPLASPLYTNLSANKILAPSDTMKTIRIGITNGYGIWLPNAMSLQGANRQVILKNTQGINVTVYDNSGNYIVTLAPYAQALFWCTDITTASGSWKINNLIVTQTSAGGSFTAFSANGMYAISICAITPTTAVGVYISNSSGYFCYCNVLTISTNGSISVGGNTNLNGYFWVNNFVDTKRINDTSLLLVTANTYAGYAMVLSVSGTTITVNTYYSYATNDGTYQVMFESLCALSATAFVVCYKQTSHYCYANVLTLSGTTISVGTKTTVYAQPSGGNTIATLSSTSVILFLIGNNRIALSAVLTISGTTISVGSMVTVYTDNVWNNALCTLSPTVALVGYLNGNTNYTMCLNALNINGTTITVGSQLTLNSQSGYPCLSELSSSNAILICRDGTTNSTTRVISVDGLSVSATAPFTLYAFVDPLLSICKLSTTKALTLYLASVSNCQTRVIDIANLVY
jgi:hypothetical protein